MASKLSSLSISFPCDDEEANVENASPAALAAGGKVTDDLEVVIVNDGNPDRSGEMADRVAVTHTEIRAVHNNPDREFDGALQPVPEPSLLLLIPAYNEEHRIEPVLRGYSRYFQEHYSGPFQVVVVLNGCRDNTLEVVQRVATDHPSVRWMEFREPIGKGGALIEGLKLAPLADLIGYVDADGATPPRAYHELVNWTKDADCVIGSRWLPGAVLHVEQSGRRQFASRVFHFIIEVLFGMGIRDTQCGAKVMRRVAVENVHASLCIADMAFDINLLYSLKRAGFRVLELPTEWADKIGSKVALGRASLSMFLSALRVRLMYTPIYRWTWMTRMLRPIEGWVYRRLRQARPRSGPAAEQLPSGGAATEGRNVRPVFAEAP